MPEDQYIVIQRGKQWWILMDGHRHGPFETHEEAIAGAVARAKQQENVGRKSEVSWQDPDDGNPTVYRSDD